jgi:glyoxylate reductase
VIQIKPKVFVTREIPEPGLEILRKHCDVEVNTEDRVLTKEEIISGVEGKDALLCLLTDTIDEEVIKSNPNLKIIANYAVGYNNVDVNSASEHSIPVTNTPGVLTDTTADLAFSLLLASARRIVESDKFMRCGKYVGWAPKLLLGYDVHGKTLGIIGLGRIGTAMAKRAAGFGMKIIYYEHDGPKESAQLLKAESVDFETLLRESDFITLHVPLNDRTRHMISTKEFEMMKKSAILVNTSRGPVVNEEALVKALQTGEIAGAGLDVFEDEPAMKPGLAELNNAVIVPHIGSATIDARNKMATMAAENVIAALECRTPPNLVNRSAMENRVCKNAI